MRTPSRLEADDELTDFASPSPLPIYFRALGNGKFFSEQLIAYEAGFRTSMRRNFYLDIALFYNDYNYLSSFQVGSFFLEPTPAPAHAVLPLVIANGIEGEGYGFEVAPDWRPVKWWEVKVSYSHLNLKLRDRPGSNDPTSVLTDEGSSPRNQVMAESLINISKGFEFDQTLRNVSALPAQSSSNVTPSVFVTGYFTADARFGWHITRDLELSIDGQNLLQPHHAEFGGDPGRLVGIERSVYGKLTWNIPGK